MTFSKTDLSISSKANAESSFLIRRLFHNSTIDRRILFYFWQTLGILLLASHFSLIFACPQSIKIFPFLTLVSVAFSLKYGIKAIFGGVSGIIVLTAYNFYFETLSLWNVFFCLSTLISHFSLYGCFKETFSLYEGTLLFSEKCKEDQFRLIEQMEEYEKNRLQEREELFLEIEKLKQEAELRKLEKNTLDHLLENAKGEIFLFNVQKDKIIHEIKELRINSHILKEENVRLTSKIEELNEILENNQNKKNSSLNSEIESLKKEKVHLESLLEIAYKNIDQNEQNLIAIEQEKSQFINSKFELESRHQLLVNEYNNLTDQFKDKVDREDYLSLKSEYQEISQKLQSLANVQIEKEQLLHSKLALEEQCHLLQNRCQSLLESLDCKIDKADYEELKTQHTNLYQEIEKLNVHLEQKTLELHDYSQCLEQEKVKEAAMIQEKYKIEIHYREKFSLLEKELNEKELKIVNFEKILLDYTAQLNQKDSIFKLETEHLLNKAQKEIADFIELKNEYEIRLNTINNEKDILVKKLDDKNLEFEELEKQKKQLKSLLNQLKTQFEDKNNALSEARQERYQFETQYLLMLQEKKLEQHSQNPLWKLFESLEKHYCKEKEDLFNEITLLEETISFLMNSNQ